MHSSFSTIAMELSSNAKFLTNKRLTLMMVTGGPNATVFSGICLLAVQPMFAAGQQGTEKIAVR